MCYILLRFYFNELTQCLNQNQQAMKEYLLRCPYCWHDISTVVQTNIVKQQYIEDCRICENPMQVVVDCVSNQITQLVINPIAQ